MSGVLVQSPPPRHPLARFAAVSVASTVTTLAVIAVLEDVPRLGSAPAAAVAAAVGFSVSYILTRVWVFPGGGKRGHLASLAQLGCLALAGLGLCGITGWAVDLFAQASHLAPVTRLVAEELAESLALAALFGVRLRLSRALFAVTTAGPGRRSRPALSELAHP
jgi:putative flippase GtrA